ncbi:hypothetical protein D3C86_1967470 [compost metagenome]
MSKPEGDRRLVRRLIVRIVQITGEQSITRICRNNKLFFNRSSNSPGDKALRLFADQFQHPEVKHISDGSAQHQNGADLFRQTVQLHHQELDNIVIDR